MPSHGLRIGIMKGARGPVVPQIITQTAPASVGTITDGETPASGYTAGSYASSAGTISGVVSEVSVNGGAFSAAAMSVAVAESDVLNFRDVVTDSVANERTFATGSTVVQVAPATDSALLLETGDTLLLETGDRFLLEAA